MNAEKELCEGVGLPSQVVDKPTHSFVTLLCVILKINRTIYSKLQI